MPFCPNRWRYQHGFSVCLSRCPPGSSLLALRMFWYKFKVILYIFFKCDYFDYLNDGGSQQRRPSAAAAVVAAAVAAAVTAVVAVVAAVVGLILLGRLLQRLLGSRQQFRLDERPQIGHFAPFRSGRIGFLFALHGGRRRRRRRRRIC